MRTFMYTIKSPVGLHARHAGLLVKETSRYQSEITVAKGEKTANGKGVLSLMGLGVKQGDVIAVSVDGPDEDAAALHLKAFLWTNF